MTKGPVRCQTAPGGAPQTPVLPGSLAVDPAPVFPHPADTSSGSHPYPSFRAGLVSKISPYYAPGAMVSAPPLFRGPWGLSMGDTVIQAAWSLQKPFSRDQDIAALSQCSPHHLNDLSDGIKPSSALRKPSMFFCRAREREVNRAQERPHRSRGREGQPLPGPYSLSPKGQRPEF